MKTKRKTDAGLAVRTGVLILVMIGHGAGCTGSPAHRPERPPDPGARGTPAAQARHADPAGHPAGHPAEEEAWEALSLTLEQIGEKSCEHGTPAHACSECRYEVGVVRVPDSLRTAAGEDGPGLIRTERVSTRPEASGLVLTGEVAWNETAVVHVRPRVPGVVRSVGAGLGDRARRGDVLFTLQSVELGRALSDHERSRTLSDLSRRNLERETSLYERRISSEQDMIEARIAYERHENQRKAAEKALRALGVAAGDLAPIPEGGQGAREGLLSVRAPRDGTIIETHAVAGERVAPESEVMVLADPTALWVWADVYERDLPRLLEAEKTGAIPAEVLVRAFPGRPFPARIDYIGAQMDPATRTLKVRATVNNPDRLLRPGMFCDLRMDGSGRREVAAVPRDAVLSHEGRPFVFKHWKGDDFVSRPVKVGRALGDHVEILEGLVPGERIVTRGAFLLKSDVLREKMGAGCAD